MISDEDESRTPHILIGVPGLCRSSYLEARAPRTRCGSETDKTRSQIRAADRPQSRPIGGVARAASIAVNIGCHVSGDKTWTRPEV
jgi:hypothetical protein